MAKNGGRAYGAYQRTDDALRDRAERNTRRGRGATRMDEPMDGRVAQLHDEAYERRGNAPADEADDVRVAAV